MGDDVARRNASSSAGVRERDGLNIVHVDMDCFFAAVEVASDPALIGRPVIVGGTGSRGVVASASYEARFYGVHSAMPIGEARRLCRNGVYLAPRHDLYASVSRELMAVLRQTTPLVEPISLDEAFLDIAGAHRLLGSSAEIANNIRREVFTALGFACSVGVGRTKLVAKLASKAAKPTPSPDGAKKGRGVVVVSVEEEERFLKSHPVSALPGLGPRTVERLFGLGVTSVADLAELASSLLISMFGRSHGQAIFDLAHGIDERTVVSDRPMRSIGHEETFSTDEYDETVLVSAVVEHADGVARRLREAKLVGKTVSLKVRYSDFETVTRSRTLAQPTASAVEIKEAAKALLVTLAVNRPVRLIGVSASNLSPEGVLGAQLALFSSAPPDTEPERAMSSDEERARHDEVDQTTDEIKRRFGTSSISTAGASNRRRRRDDDAAPPHRPL